MSLDIIIVNWNAGVLLEKCISSIYESTHGIDFKIIVVDNNSTDKSLKNLPYGNREILIKSDSNLGFAKACNIAADRSDSEFLLFLNPDTVIGSPAIEYALDYLRSTPDAGIVGVRQESENRELRPSCSRFLKLKNVVNDIFGLSKVFPNEFKPATIMTDWDHTNSSKVDQVMGSFMMLHRSDFVKLNGFDEQFFVYYEDMDLSKRLLELGKFSYFLSHISIIHSGWGTSDLVKAKRLFYSLSGRIKYSRKHLGKLESFTITLLTLFPESLFRIIYSLFTKGSVKNILHTIGGYNLLIGWLIRKK